MLLDSFRTPPVSLWTFLAAFCVGAAAYEAAGVRSQNDDDKRRSPNWGQKILLKTKAAFALCVKVILDLNDNTSQKCRSSKHNMPNFSWKRPNSTTSSSAAESPTRPNRSSGSASSVDSLKRSPSPQQTYSAKQKSSPNLLAQCRMFFNTLKFERILTEK